MGILALTFVYLEDNFRLEVNVLLG